MLTWHDDVACCRGMLTWHAPAARARYNHGRTEFTDFSELLERMSPDLRGEVAIRMNSGWIADMPHFTECPKSMLIRCHPLTPNPTP